MKKKVHFGFPVHNPWLYNNTVMEEIFQPSKELLALKKIIQKVHLF
jgi:hypothetical protein